MVLILAFGLIVMAQNETRPVILSDIGQSTSVNFNRNIELFPAKIDDLEVQRVYKWKAHVNGYGLYFGSEDPDISCKLSTRAPGVKKLTLGPSLKSWKMGITHIYLEADEKAEVSRSDDPFRQEIKDYHENSFRRELKKNLEGVHFIPLNYAAGMTLKSANGDLVKLWCTGNCHIGCEGVLPNLIRNDIGIDGFPMHIVRGGMVSRSQKRTQNLERP